jgi:hypothetical protein
MARAIYEAGGDTIGKTYRHRFPLEPRPMSRLPSSSTASSPWSGTTPNKPAQLLDLSSDEQTAQARYVQHHYVRSQVRVINNQRADLVNKAMQALSEKFWVLPGRSQAAADSRKQLALKYAQLQSSLKTAPLTINFTARNWFSKECPYKNYAQMYELSVDKRANQVVLKGNSVITRDEADTRVTFKAPHMLHGTDVVSYPVFDGTKKKDKKFQVEKWNPAYESIRRTMNTGGVDPTAADGEYVVHNRQFNPKTRQIFAGLNWGRRPHGSTTHYGWSFFELSDEFKTNALFFAGDSFNKSLTACSQVTYDTLGALYLYAQDWLRQELIKACIHGVLPGDKDSAAMNQLVEAHLFEPLVYSTGIKAMYVCVDPSLDSSLEVLDSNDKPSGVVDHGLIATIKQNALKFARDNGIKDLNWV